MAYCPNCGTQNDDNAVYCENCGCQLRNIDGSTDFSDTKDKLNKAAKTVKDFSVKGYGFIKGKTKEASEKAKNYDTTGIKNGINRNRKLILAVVSVIALVIVAVIVMSIIGSSNTPEKALDKFFGAYLKGNYNKMYSYFFDYDSDFINADSVAACLDNITNISHGTINQYKVKKSAPTESLDGYSEDYYGGEDSSSDLSRQYTIEYLKNGEARPQYIAFDVVTVKSGAFSKSYKVSLSNYVESNVSLICLKGTQIKIDGIALSNPVSDATDMFDRADTDEDLKAVYDKYAEGYVINKIFSGKHNLEISGGGFEPYSSSAVFYDDEVLNLVEEDTERALTQESREAINKKSVAVIRALFGGASEGKRFTELGIEDDTGLNSRRYNELLSDMSGSRYTITDIRDIVLDDDYSYGSIVDMNYKFYYDYEYYDSWYEETRSDSDYDYFELYYIFDSETNAFRLYSFD